MAADPLTEFSEWFAAAVSAGVSEANAAILATTGREGKATARAVLVKDFGSEGLTWYTNLASSKSRHLRENPWAALTFLWSVLHRQVRFEGPVKRVSDAEADTYFATRPRGAQLAAHASMQSSVVESRDVLEIAFSEADSRFPGKVPRPEHWGGWRMSPTSVEFWQGRPNRFHDRVRYRLSHDGWTTERLAP